MQTSISARHRVGVTLEDRMGYFGEGLGVVWHFECVVGYAVSTTKTPTSRGKQAHLLQMEGGG